MADPIVEKKEDPSSLERVENLMKDISEKISAPAVPAKTPESQPDPVKVYNDRKTEIMKKMNWNEDQFAFHEQEKLSAAAPLMKDMALLKVEKANKDYDKLKEPFEKEIRRYETEMRRAITPDLAEEIFYMIKGREISAGRYKPDSPGSQPPRKPDTSGDGRPRISRPAYNEAPGMTGGEGGEGGGEAPQLSDREKEYVKIFGPKVTAESYVKMREEKRAGVRAISDRSYRAPEIDRKSAGPADRDLASLWDANGGNLP